MSEKVARISLSLPPEVVEALDVVLQARGNANRSQVVASILREELIGLRRSNPDEVMAGTITLFYDDAQPGLAGRLSSLQRNHLKEVVSSLSVLLEKSMRMEVLVVQGPLRVLDTLVSALTNLKGVRTGKLTLTDAVLPPLYGRNETAETNPPTGDQP